MYSIYWIILCIIARKMYGDPIYVFILWKHFIRAIFTLVSFLFTELCFTLCSSNEMCIFFIFKRELGDFIVITFLWSQYMFISTLWKYVDWLSCVKTSENGFGATLLYNNFKTFIILQNNFITKKYYQHKTWMQ